MTSGKENTVYEEKKLPDMVNGISVFRRTVEEENYKEFLRFVENYKESIKQDKDFHFETRTVYNYLASAIAWKKQSEDLADEDNHEVGENEFRDKLCSEFSKERVAFLQVLRNFLSHYSGFKSTMTTVNNGELNLSPRCNRLEQHLKNKDGSFDKKSYEYYKKQDGFVNLVKEIKDFHNAIEKTEKWFIEQKLEYYKEEHFPEREY